MSGRFDGIVGHERIIRSLSAAMDTHQVSHAYIFSGPAGSGKSMLANAFAKALQCESTADSCSGCTSCRVFDSGNHPDIFYISPEGKSLGVDDVRERVVKQLRTAPFRYRYKIFVIDKAHTLTVQAQNALLKTIEEPAGYGIFLLLAEGLLDFLPTVLSRCVAYKLMPIAYGKVYGSLVARGIADDTARLAAVYAQGVIGRALQLAADAEFITMRESLHGLLPRLPEADLVEVFGFAKGFDAYRERIYEALDIMYLWYADALVLRAADRRFALGANTVAVGAEVFTGLTSVWRARQQLKRHANFQLTIEVMLLDIWRAARPA